MTDNPIFGKQSLVDRANGRRLPAPRADNPEREDLFYPVRCANPDCNNVRWLTRSDAERAEAAQRVCKKCQAAAAGRKGYAATVALYGVDFALKAVRQKQLECPSSYEVIVDSWLADLAVTYDISYETQVEFSATDAADVLHFFLIVFVIQSTARAISVYVNCY